MLTLHHSESLGRFISLDWDSGKVIPFSATFVSTASPVGGNETVRLEGQLCLLVGP